MVKRIALIRNSNSFDVGGAEIFPIDLAKMLTLDGYEPFLLSSNKKTLAMAQAANIKSFHSPWWSFQNFSGLRIFLFPLYLIWILVIAVWYSIFILRNHIDVIHPQSRDDFVAATFAAKILRKKVVWTDHADLKAIYMNHNKWYKNPVGKLVYSASKLAKYVTIESNSEKNLIEKSLQKDLPGNYMVIHIGVLDTHKQVKQKNKKLVLVSTSRLVKDKGISELIEAFKLVNDPTIELKLCGDGPDINLFKKRSAGVSNIVFLGHVKNVVDILESSDILVHPTYHEGFGLSLVEAEMCGLPIIASNVGSIPEIVRDGFSGILVEPKSPAKLAEAIKLLAKNPKMRADMGKSGRQIFLDKFQLDKIAREKFIPLYEK